MTITKALPYPAVYVMEGRLMFNAKAAKLFEASSVRVSKMAPHLFFMPTDVSTGTFQKRSGSKNYGFVIGCRELVRQTGLRPGYYYRLYRAKNGAYAVKTNEAMTKEEAINDDRN